MKPLFGMIILSTTCFGPGCCSQETAPSSQEVSRQTQRAEDAVGNQSGNRPNKRRLSGSDHYGQANYLKGGHESEEALKEFNLAIENGYDTVDLRIDLGELLNDQLNRKEEAIEQFRIAARRDNRNWRAHWPLAQSLLATKRYKEALKEIRIADLLDPEGHADGFYFFYRAKALDGLNRYAQALGQYEAYLKSHDDVGDTPNVLEARDRIKAIKGKLSRN